MEEFVIHKLKADFLDLLLCRKAIPPDRLNTLGIENGFDLIRMLVLEANVALLGHQD